MLKKGDFHIHSTASDGSLSPEEIITSARHRGIDLIAITDHNTIKGIDVAAQYCKHHKISIVPAVELSTRYKNESIHLLGYFRSTKYRNSNFQKALDAIKNHKVQQLRSSLFHHTDSKSSSRHLSVYEGIHLLRLFDASVVLAHPGRINRKTLADLLTYKFDGLEAKYCLHSTDDTSYFIDLALNSFSYYTGGSDFHSSKRKDLKHCMIGQPHLNENEIKRFIKKSGVLLLG